MRGLAMAIAASVLLAGCGSRQEPDAAPSASASTEPEPPIAFAMCSACHKVTPDTNTIGPTLFGVVGRKAGSVPGFAYSDAMLHSGKIWDAASLDTYLTNPREAVPGNRMTFAGIEDPARRKEVIEYLKTLK